MGLEILHTSYIYTYMRCLYKNVCTLILNEAEQNEDEQIDDRA